MSTQKSLAKQIVDEVAPIVKSAMEIQRERKQKLVRGKFKFDEVPGGLMSFTFREFKGERPKRYDMIDGQVYEIPLGVAIHLNTNCWYPEYKHINNASSAFGGGYTVQGGQNPYNDTAMTIGRKIARCSFQSLQFMDIEDLTDIRNIVSVELSPL